MIMAVVQLENSGVLLRVYFLFRVFLDYGQLDLESLRVEVPAIEMSVLTPRDYHVSASFFVFHEFCVNLVALVGVALVEFQKVILVVVKAHGTVHATEKHVLVRFGRHAAETDCVD